MKKGKIIFLNGVSCSGKTTLAKKLQERLSDPFYSLNLDTFLNMTPEKYFRTDEERIIANKAATILPYTIRAFSDMGLNTIVEHIFLNIDNLLETCIELLHEYPVMFVHVTCPFEELRRRVKERIGSDNIEGHEWQLSHLVPENTYDLTIDTSKDECVDMIMELVGYLNRCTAFKTLWAQQNVM